MYDKLLILEILDRIYSATQTILERFRPVKSIGDFTGSAAGMEKLDSICMQLIAIGDGLIPFVIEYRQGKPHVQIHCTGMAVCTVGQVFLVD